MSSDLNEVGAGRPVPAELEIEKRGYNPPPVSKVQRPAPTAPAPRPGVPVPATEEHS